MKRMRAQRGFTLVEIMIVVAIIALLAAIAIPNVLRGRASANESAAIGNLRALISSVEMYRSVYGAYPTDWDGSGMYTANPPFGPPSFNADLDGAAQLVQGYNYRYQGTANNYDFSARSSSSPGTGTRTFWADESGQAFHCLGDSTSLTVPAGTKTVSETPGNC